MWRSSSSERQLTRQLRLYLMGHVLFMYRMKGAVQVPRVIAAALLLVALPLAVGASPLAVLCGMLLIAGTLIIVGSRRHAETRRRLREQTP